MASAHRGSQGRNGPALLMRALPGSGIAALQGMPAVTTRRIDYSRSPALSPFSNRLRQDGNSDL